MTALNRLATLTLSALLATGSLRADTNRLTEVVRRAVDYHRQGLQAEAEKAAAEALSMLDSSGGPGFDGAAGLNDLASLAYAQGDLGRAAQLFQRSREAYLALAGPDDTRLASVLYNLAGVYVEQGRYSEAEPLYRGSLEIRERELGAGHPLVAEVWNNLGLLYLHQRKYKEAESWLGKALELWEQSAGSNAAAYSAVALNNLALLSRLQGGSDTAESLYKRAVAVEEKVFGREHPEVAATLMSLAALERAKGNSRQATETYSQALAVLENKLGAQDPLAVEARQQLRELTGGAETRGEYQILMAPTRQEAEELRRRVEKGENFAELAKRHSIDPNASSGGHFRARASELRKELRVELDRLGIGRVSAVFPLAGNWAIVKKISEPAPGRE